MPANNVNLQSFSEEDLLYIAEKWEKGDIEGVLATFNSRNAFSPGVCDTCKKQAVFIWGGFIAREYGKNKAPASGSPPTIQNDFTSMQDSS